MLLTMTLPTLVAFVPSCLHTLNLVCKVLVLSPATLLSTAAVAGQVVVRQYV